jgi:hypothetical protein
MSEETLETTIGQFKTKTKFLEFIGGKGQFNFISKEATIEGKYLSGLGLDGITFKLTICDEGTVNFDEVDTNQTTKEQRERLLEIIEEKTIRPFMKKMVINELPFFSTKEVSGKKISLYLAVEYVKPINKLANFLQEGEVKVDETHANKINSLMDLLGDDDDTEINNQEEVVVEEIKEPVKNEPMKAAGKPVTKGIKALRITCFHSTLFSLKPLARAVNTYCLPISSKNAFLVSMVVTANAPNTLAVMGMAMCHK